MRVRTTFQAPQFDVRSIGFAHDQKARAESAAITAGATVASGVLELYDKYKNDRMEREAQEYTLQSTLGEYAFVQRYGTQTSFAAEEVGKFLVEEDIRDSGIQLTEPYMTDDGEVGERPRKDIPAYEVYPKMYKAFMEKSIPMWAETITNDKERSKIVAIDNIKLSSKVLKNYVDAVGTQRRQMRAELDANNKALLDKGQYDVVRNSIKNSTVLTPNERDIQLNGVDVREEKDMYDNIMAQGDMTRLNVMSVKLAQPFEAYQKEGGKLSAPAKLTYKRHIDSTISRLNAEKKAVNNARISAARSELREMTTNVKQGFLPPINKMRDTMAIVAASGTPMDVLELQRFKEAEIHGEAFKFIQMHDTLTSQAKIDQVMLDSVGKVRFPDKLQEELHEANLSKAADIEHDAVGHARKHFNLPRFDRTNPAKALVQAKHTEEFVKNQYHKPHEYLSKAGWGDLRVLWEEQDLNQKLDLLQTASTTLGPDVEKFWESGYKHDAGPMVVIGSIANEHPVGARMALQGSEYLKGKHGEPAIVLPKEFDIRARELLSTMFADPEVAGQRLSAIRGAYAYLAYHEDGGLLTDTVDEDLLERALLTTTKGKIEYGDRVFEAPNLKTNTAQFERRIESISATHWDREGGFLDYPSKRVKQDLDDGKLSFRRIGTGQYLIVNQDDVPLKSAIAPNDLYIFDYDKPIFSVDQENAHMDYKSYREKLTDPDALFDKRQKRLNIFMRRDGGL